MAKPQVTDQGSDTGRRARADERQQALARAGETMTALQAAIARLEALPDDPGGRIHAVFARLYLASTRGWLAALAPLQDPDPVSRMIAAFWGFYQRGVLDVVEGRSDTVPPAWQAYHRAAGRITLMAPFPVLLWVLSLGIHAHVRRDIGCSIVEAERSYARDHGHPPAEDAFEAVFDRRQIRRLFRRATLEFIRDEHPMARPINRLWLHASWAATWVLLPIWFGVFQHWRRASYRDAIQSGFEPDQSLPAPK